jgi:hypothetical protein
VDPPLASGLAWFLDYRGVQQAYRAALKNRLQLDSVLFEQLQTQLSQPPLSVAQAAQQGHIGDIGNPC